MHIMLNLDGTGTFRYIYILYLIIVSRNTTLIFRYQVKRTKCSIYIDTLAQVVCTQIQQASKVPTMSWKRLKI